MGLLDLRLLPQLIQEKGLLPHLDVVAEEECNRELKKEEEISSHAETFLFYSQAPDAEGRVAQNENINVIFIHEEIPFPFLLSLPRPVLPKGSGQTWEAVAGQNRIIKPDRVSVGGVTFTPRNMCPAGSNEKQNPINICLNVSSFDCKSLNVFRIFPSSNEPFLSG